MAHLRGVVKATADGHLWAVHGFASRSLCSAWLLAGCVFTPPPPLPEEAAAKREQEQARLAAIQGGTAVDPDAGGEEGATGAAEPAQATGDPGGEPVAGAPPRVGMSEEEIRAHAKAQGDPEEGEFTLAEALEGLEGEGNLWVRLDTSRGVIECRLYEDEAPKTVANFVGLARGLRPHRDPDTGEWETGRYYDDTVFHRVIPGFMIQAGDPQGTGQGNAGYVIPDEIDPELAHDEAGVLSMANRGPGTGSSQFFITLGPAPHLDGKHTIFGECTEETLEVADDIAMVPRGPTDKPVDDEVIETVEIFRR